MLKLFDRADDRRRRSSLCAAALSALTLTLSAGAGAGAAAAPAATPSDAQEGASASAAVDVATRADAISEAVEGLDKPLYSPFIERYVLDELKQLRIDVERNRADLIERVVDTELTLADRAVNYVADSVTYFFYVIAAASSVLVLVGWRSISDVRGGLSRIADEEFAKISSKYEARLSEIEQELARKSAEIEQNQQLLETARESHSLWLRATQETAPQNKIALYDQLLQLDPQDTEAMTYKADAALMMDEPRWAISLCERALEIDPENGFAHYQLACAYAVLKDTDRAIEHLDRAITAAAGFRDDATREACFDILLDDERFRALLYLEEDEE